MIAAGYDALTGAAVVLIGCGVGVYGSTVNPFATGIASGFAGVSISDGLVLRLITADRRTRLRHLLRAALRRPGEEPIRAARWCDDAADNDAHFSVGDDAETGGR